MSECCLYGDTHSFLFLSVIETLPEIRCVNRKELKMTQEFPVDIAEEMRVNYLNYALSVINGRAVPSAADGLKPVHRRSIFAMSKSLMTHEKPHKKSARIVGDVLGKYHPHGDNVVYDAIVRLAQPFNMRYPLIDGQGNFGSIDGDSPAAMRYTEVRLTKIAELLADFNDVDYKENYDGTEKEPVLLGAGFPNLLANGAEGIAVGIATSIPPHHLGSIIEATKELLLDENISVTELAKIVKAPDFPTGGIIMGNSGALEAYKTGRGKVTIRARVHFEENDSGNPVIVVTELPYQVNKASFLIKLGEYIKEGKYPEISNISDESTNDIRVCITLKRNSNAEVVLNRLYKETQLQINFNFNMVALDNHGKHRLMNLKELLSEYIKHRTSVVYRSIERVLEQQKRRLKRLNAKRTIIENPKIINVIRSTYNFLEAEEKLAQYEEVLHDDDPQLNPDLLSHEQIRFILEMRISQLVRIEKDLTISEQKSCIVEIARLEELLRPDIDLSYNESEGQSSYVYNNLKRYIIELLDKTYDEILHITKGDKRKSELAEEISAQVDEDFIDNVPVVITLTHENYIKVTDAANYHSQGRGGVGKNALSMKGTDRVKTHLTAKTHDYLYIVTNYGRIYTPKVHHMPVGERTGRGRPINNVLDLKEGEQITAILPVDKSLRCDENTRLFFATRKGQIKMVHISAFKNTRDKGIIAVNIAEDDEVIGMRLVNAGDNVLLVSAKGQLMRYKESHVRVSLRGSGTIRGIRLSNDDYLVSIAIEKPESYKNRNEILVITNYGIGKITKISDFRIVGRGGKGVKTTRLKHDNEQVVAVLELKKGSRDVTILSSAGKLICVPLDEISQLSRTAHGVKLIDLGEGEVVVSAELNISRE